MLVLADKHFRQLPRSPKGERRPFPAWADDTPNSIWIYDSTDLTRCAMTVLITEDLVSRQWISHVVSAEETHTQVQLASTAALQAEGLYEAAHARAEAISEAGLLDPDVDDALAPILLAVSDNGSQMIARDTRKFMAMLAIAQHFGRPSTPTDQAWIESLNGTIKLEWPHLLQIDDPAVLRAQLEIVRLEYNTVRLHSGIGYPTPDDEHEGRGEAIRKAREAGLEQARQRRLAHRRAEREGQLPRRPHGAG